MSRSLAREAKRSTERALAASGITGEIDSRNESMHRERKSMLKPKPKPKT